MGCLPFCCFFQNIGPKVFAFIAIGCDVAKIVLTIASFFLLEFSILLLGVFMSIFEFFPTIANIILMSIIIVYISNGSAFDKNNSCCICMCIVSLILCAVLFVLRFIFFIDYIVEYNKAQNWMEENIKMKASGSDWAKLIIPYIFLFILDIAHILSVIYLYKLLKIKSNECYRDYIDKGPNEPANITIANTTNINNVSGNPMTNIPQVSPNQLQSPGYPNQLPPPGNQNQYVIN